jgi:superfamily II DNA or RNA helicase
MDFRRYHTKKPIKKKYETESSDEELAITIKIKRAGTYINIDDVDRSIVRKIKNCFTIRNQSILGYEVATPIFHMEKSRLYIPRFGYRLLKKSLKHVEIERKNFIKCLNPIKFDVPDIEPTRIQEIVLDEIHAKWFSHKRVCRGTAGVILNLQAGLGKTFLAMLLIAQLQCRTLVVCHNTTILKQWLGLLKKYFPKNDIGSYYTRAKKHGDICVGIINTLVSESIDGFSSPKEFYRTFDFIIFDEAHEYCSATRSKIFQYQAPYMLGLSATPCERPDNLYWVIQWGIGPVLEAASLPEYSVEDAPFKGHVTQIRYYGPEQYTKHIICEKLEMASVVKIMQQAAEDPFRNKMIIDLITEYHKMNCNIFVFGTYREHLEDLRKLLHETHENTKSDIITDEKEEQKFNELKTIRLVGGSSEVDYAVAKNERRIIFTTYQYMGTGCSIPKMDCAIFAMPRKSKIRQYANRIFRLGSDYSITRHIVDIVDMKTILKNQWYARKKYYTEQAYDIEVRNIRAPVPSLAKK